MGNLRAEIPIGSAFDPILYVVAAPNIELASTKMSPQFFMVPPRDRIDLKKYLSAPIYKRTKRL